MENFLDFLEAKGLSENTVLQYLQLYERFPHQDLSQETINRFIKRCPNFMIRAFVKNYLAFLNIKDYDIPKFTGHRKNKEGTVLDENALRKLTDALYSTKTLLGALLELSYLCGLRISEAMYLTPSDFDWDSWEGTDKPMRLKIKGKGNAERIIIVPNYMMKIMKELVLEHLYKAGKNPAEQMNTRIFYFSKQYWRKILAKKSIEVLGKRISPHDLRRSRATGWWREGKDITSIQKRLGHADISTTQRYIKPDIQVILSEWEEEVASLGSPWYPLLATGYV